jgi:hypothetical protein
MLRHCYLLLLVLFLPSARAADPVPSDDEMLATCRKELTERLFEGKAHGESFISKQSIERQTERVIIKLDLASGEGRSVSGTCVFRNGKLFDIK